MSAPAELVDSTVLADPVVSVHNLNHWFGQGEARSHALKNNKLNVYPGEVVVMSGRSGSGKTTLLTLIGT
ncbi:MAG TPA: ATP-binding cassette domain-containing protein, partial [Pirellulales bacterium]